MIFFGKNNKTSEEMQNWYQDRYVSVAIQRNFLLLFSLFISGALLVCLILIKRFQENKVNDPYLIEYDKKTGYMTVVETKSKKEYTAQQAVKESMLLQYIDRREAPRLVTLEEDMNYVRVTTSSKIYHDYLNEIGNNIKTLKSAGVNPKYDIKVKSLQYLAANRVQLLITKSIVIDGKDVSKTDYSIVMSFGFVDIEMPIEDMRVNPLGFQVTYYHASEIKTFKSAIVDNKEDINTNDVNKNT